ncbi:hypothetical protein QOZ80_9AG0691680 [Eleusine coracana subsp. coracana]|nr:hypothetical protein QOZ80_9AG0691680 [Eleusine coracana subsp. coracana]
MGSKRAVTAAAGTAALVYVALSGRLSSSPASEEGAVSSEVVEPARLRRQRRQGEIRWPERAPESWREAAAVAARTAGFLYGETLGKWPLGDIAFGINHYMRTQGNLQHEFAGSNCLPLQGPGVRQELIGLLRYLKLCMFFTKKPYEVFQEFGGYDQSDILIRNSKPRIMKPAFTIVRDESTKCFLLFIRGAVSTKERLTAAAAAEVPFRHLLQDGCKSNLVIGHVHCGMVAAARWIADQAIPCLSKAVEQFPDYGIKIIGHSMGASIAAILTYMLRENEELSSASCIAFGPAACMTWNLAESGKEFITTVVNRNDVVPSFGTASAANLRTEVMASSWASELRERIINRSASFVQSHIPSIADPRSKDSDADMFLPHTPMDEFKLSANMRAIVNKHSALSCWSFVEVYRQTLEPFVNPTQGSAALMSTYVGAAGNYDKLAVADRVSCFTWFTEELNHGRSDAEGPDKEDKATDPEQEHMEQLLRLTPLPPTTSQETRQLYPPGRIMHMVVLPEPEEPGPSEQDHQDEVVAIYETPRSMYSKIRLAKSMISEHYMPRYIETMEMLIEKLAQDNDDDRDDQVG